MSHQLREHGIQTDDGQQQRRRRKRSKHHRAEARIGHVAIDQVLCGLDLAGDDARIDVGNLPRDEPTDAGRGGARPDQHRDVAGGRLLHQRLIDNRHVRPGHFVVNRASLLVRHDADDRQPRIACLRLVEKADPPANRILADEILSRQRLVDNGDAQRAFAIAGGEAASLPPLDVHQREIPGRHRLRADVVNRGVRRRRGPAVDHENLRASAAAQRQNRRQCGVRHAAGIGQSIHDPIEEGRSRGVGAVLLRRQIQRHRDQTGRVESERCGSEPDRALDQQSGARQEHQ